MQTLITAINADLDHKARALYSPEKIEAVVKAHQTQYPGSWQNWDKAEMATYMASGLNLAAQKSETVTARILQEGF